MLDLFRKRGLSSAIYGVIIVATIFVFVIQFRPNSGQKTASLKEACVATVRGWCIDPKDYRSSYRLLMPRDQEGTPSPAKARQMGLSKITLDGLVERELLLGEAEQIGLRVSDDEITDQIYDGWIRVSVPAADPQAAYKLRLRDGRIYGGFKDQKTKQFDMKVYERQIRNIAGRSPTEFREEQGREILAAKMRDLVLAPVRVSDSEAEDLYVTEKSSATVGSIAVKQSWVKRWGVTAAQADIDAYAKDPTVAKEIENILKDRDPLDMPKANHVRHIQAKTPPTPTEDDLRKAAQKLADARARVQAGASFAEVARELSDDKQSAFQGGDMGDRTMSPAFQDAVNALKPGEMTKTAIQTPFGLELIMKDDPAKESEVRAVVLKDIARELYLKSKSLEKTKELAGKLLADVKGDRKPEEAIAALIASLPKPAAEPKPLEITRLPKTDDAGDAGASPKSSDEKKSAAAADAGGPGGDPDRPQLVTSSPFSKGGDPIGGLSPEAHNQLIAFAFSAEGASAPGAPKSTPGVGDWMKEPLRADDGFLLVTLKDQKTATHDEFEKEKDTFEEMLLLGKRAEAMSLHVKRLRDQAKSEIKVDESYIADLRGDAGAGGTGEEEDEEAP